VPLSDLLVLLVIATATGASAVLLRRQGVRGRGYFAAVWVSFYGFVLAAMMLAHSAEILYRVLAGRPVGSTTGAAYDFHIYSLLLLGALLTWAGAECLRAAPRLGGGSTQARRTAVRATVAALAIVAPLIPIQMVFGIALSVLSILTLLVLARSSPTSESIPRPAQARSRAPIARA
jgi:hypothetical protein